MKKIGSREKIDASQLELKLRFLPPLTTFVTRLIETTVSFSSSCDESTRS